eukprot:CAMPEP_0184298436 /NCGR_PEP_ID=MMETSP1049-20130417/9252_1 /TAXON_ID=77928 /ORGANISM="Proteomonas sulcata, Strain CCMP704" /LENGTH=291 /DNA_ID=CAMNT_0026608573 /DNA_START=69 /DNA_END=944 /DNA_ORIENTATION=-
MKQHPKSPLEGHQHWVVSAVFSRDGRFIASGSADHTVRVWETSRMQEAKESPLAGHTGWVSAVEFSADTKWIVSGSHDYTVRVWHRATGTRHWRSPLTGHGGYIHSVDFSPDGDWIVSGSADKTVRVWSVVTMEEYSLYNLSDEGISQGQTIRRSLRSSSETQYFIENLAPYPNYQFSWVSSSRMLQGILEGFCNGVSFVTNRFSNPQPITYVEYQAERYIISSKGGTLLIHRFDSEVKKALLVASCVVSTIWEHVPKKSKIWTISSRNDLIAVGFDTGEVVSLRAPLLLV